MTIAGEFRHRAFFEARRYGGNEWVFVRELLQNSRDAGAGRVDLTVERRGGLDRIVCRDDGCGMTFEHAKRYLLTLYASSKTDQRDTAGRFGIGFWAVLRFHPDVVVVRSAPAGEPAWELHLSGDLERSERRDTSLAEGTEIELVRVSGGGNPVTGVWNSIQRDARHLRRRDTDGAILDVRVNHRPATAEIELDPPTLELAQGSRRGAVALAAQPRVDLLAHGLRVRTTATLDELLTQPDRRHRKALVNLDGLVPRVILDSRRLQVLMARGDARTDGELRRLVALGRRGVRRLVRDQLDQEAGLGPIGRVAARCAEALSSRWVRRITGGLALAAMLLYGGCWLAAGRANRAGETIVPERFAASPMVQNPASILRADAVDRYHGPAVAPLGSAAARLAIRYRPASADPMLVVFRVTAMDDDGRVDVPDADTALRPYLGAGCAEACLDFVLELDDLSGRVRLPVPTGHLIDTGSLRVVGGSGALWAAPDGGPVLHLESSTRGHVEYRTGVGVEIQPSRFAVWPTLPATAEGLASQLAALEPAVAAGTARDWVRSKVVYDTSGETIDRHEMAARQGLGFAERCLEVGAGDCDVQNALLAAILHRAGIPVRMAVGFVGAAGRARPGLHAWVEYRGDRGVWRSVDASRGAPNRPVSSDPEGSAAAVRPGGAGQPVESVVPGSTNGWPALPAKMGLLALIIVVGAATVVVLVRTRINVGGVRWSEAPDLAGLLRGALTRPDSYGDVPALFKRRVVPVIGGSAISLDRARVLGRRARLAVSAASSPLARRAAETGGTVVDGSRPEGASVATVLGAIDLDRWDRFVCRGRADRVTERLQQSAASASLRWKIVLCSDDMEDIAVLDGPLAGPGKDHRLVALNEGGELWQRVSRLEAGFPAAASLLVAEQVVGDLGSSSQRERRLLSILASEAVEERAELGS